MLKILVAVDGSEPTIRAIEAVGVMARSTPELEALLLCVSPGAILDPLFYGGYTATTVQKLEQDQKEQQDTILDKAAKQAEALGIKVIEPVRGYGAIANEIVRIAKERQVDQIAMGTRGMGAVGNLFLGSVAQKVLHQSPVPVLLVR